MRCVRQILAVLLAVVVAAETRADPPETSVGASGRLEQLVLPGPELVAKSLERNSPVVLRIVQVWPHGEHFRYDIEYWGLEPGEFNLAQWLIRKDGSEATGLPPIPVRVKAVLPPGHIEPNPLESGWLPRLGGYRVVAACAIVLWTAVLAALLLAGRRRGAAAAVVEPPRTLADLLRERLEAARGGRLDAHRYAELERMLFAFWRRRLDLDEIPPDEAIRRIRDDETAGPLMRQLERWMHDPARRRRGDLATLLEPYESIPVDAAD